VGTVVRTAKKAERNFLQTPGIQKRGARTLIARFSSYASSPSRATVVSSIV